MDNDKMGSFISELRKEKSLTQTELGNLVNVDNKTVSKWEKGLVTPDVVTLIKLSNIFSVRVEEIVKGERINKYQEEDLKLKNKSDNNLIIEKLNNKEKNSKKKNYIILSLTIIILILIVVIFKINNKLINDETITIDLKNDPNTPLNINGCIMSSKSSNLYIIKSVSYENIGDDKTGEELIIGYEVKLLIDNQMIATYTHNFDNEKRLDDAIDNLSFSVESSKKFNKNSSIKFQIKYTTSSNDKKITETDLKI